MNNHQMYINNTYRINALMLVIIRLHINRRADIPIDYWKGVRWLDCGSVKIYLLGERADVTA